MVAPGIGVELIEEGTYTVRLDAPFTITRAGMEQMEEVAAGTEVTLGPGDVARFPDYAAPGEIRNTGTDAVSVLGLAILSSEASSTPVPDLPAEVDPRALSSAFSSDWRKLPPGPVTVTLRRVSLPPGAELTPYEPVGLETIVVEEGNASFAFIPAGETEPSQPLIYGPGSATPLSSVQAGARRVVSNDSEEPATLLILTIAAAGDEAATPTS
jgi:hypothetical protein